MKALSLDLREQIVASSDAGEGMRHVAAKRYCVSLGMVKKLLRQRRQTGVAACGVDLVTQAGRGGGIHLRE